MNLIEHLLLQPTKTITTIDADRFDNIPLKLSNSRYDIECSYVAESVHANLGLVDGNTNYKLKVKSITEKDTRKLLPQPIMDLLYTGSECTTQHGWSKVVVEGTLSKEILNYEKYGRKGSFKRYMLDGLDVMLRRIQERDTMVSFRGVVAYDISKWRASNDLFNSNDTIEMTKVRAFKPNMMANKWIYV